MISSYLPLSQKKAIVFNKVDKCIILSDKKYRKENLRLAELLLQNNNYPIRFIKNHINKRLKFLENKEKNNT